jgi:hypothetical protein
VPIVIKVLLNPYKYSIVTLLIISLPRTTLSTLASNSKKESLKEKTNIKAKAKKALKVKNKTLNSSPSKPLLNKVKASALKDDLIDLDSKFILLTILDLELLLELREKRDLAKRKIDNYKKIYNALAIRIKDLERAYNIKRK